MELRERMKTQTVTAGRRYQAGLHPMRRPRQGIRPDEFAYLEWRQWERAPARQDMSRFDAPGGIGGDPFSAPPGGRP